MGGWIRLHRKLLKSDTWLALTGPQRSLLVVCLLKATHKEYRVNFGGKPRILKPGQFICSYKSLGSETKLTQKRLRSGLEKLILWEFLAKETAHHGTVITIVNWDQYQSDSIGEGKQTGTPRAHRGHTEGTPRAINKKEEEDKEVLPSTSQNFSEAVEDLHSQFCVTLKIRGYPEPLNPEISKNNLRLMLEQDSKKDASVTRKNISQVIDFLASDFRPGAGSGEFPGWGAVCRSTNSLRSKWSAVKRGGKQGIWDSASKAGPGDAAVGEARLSREEATAISDEIDATEQERAEREYGKND